MAPFVHGFRSAVQSVVVALALGVGAMLPAPVAAQIPGAETADFTTALNLWLADEEEAGLRGLSELAQGGNTAARLLLGVIDKTPSLQGPWLAYLPRAQRIEVMRAAGGLSGRSWLGEIADLPLAAVWLSRLGTDAGPATVSAFEALGERRAAREAFAALVARQHPALSSLSAQGLDTELLYLLWSRTNAEGRERIVAMLPSTHPQRLLMGAEATPDALVTWLRQSEAARPALALCEASCPAAELDACLISAYGAFASHAALLSTGSPVNALIPQESFVSTQRGQATTLRRILLSTEARGRRTMIARVQRETACLGDRLDAEQRRYRYQRPGAAD